MKTLGKSLIAILLLSLVLTNYSCKKIDEILTFTITDQTEITIESSLPFSLPLEIPTPDINTSSDEELSNNNTSTDLVKDVKLTSLSMKIKSPNGKTFSFLKSIHIFISTNGSDEIELAFKDNINANSSTINLTSTNEKLDKYIIADKYKLRTKVTTKETLTQDVTIEINMEYKITADPL